MSPEESTGDLKSKKRFSVVRFLLVDGLFFLLFVFTGIVTWLATGVRDISFLSGYVENQIEQQAPGLDIAFDHLSAGIFFDVNALVVDVDALRLNALESGIKLNLPKARLRIDSMRLLTGHLHLEELELFSPALQFQRNEDGSVALAMEGSASPKAAPGSYELKDILKSPLLAIADSIRLNNVQLTMAEKDKKQMITIPSLRVSFQRNGEPKVMHIEVSFLHMDEQKNKMQGSLSAVLKVNSESGEIKGEVNAEGFNLGALHMVSPSFERLSGLNLPVTLHAEFYRVRQNSPFLAKMKLDGVNGSLQSSDFPKALPIDSLHVEASAPDGMSAFTIKDLSLTSNTVEVNGTGMLTLSDAGMGGEFDVKAQNMPVNELEHYWPVSLAPESRSWVTGNIKEGTIPRAEAKISFTPEDLAQKDLPDSFIAATVEVKNTTVQYLPQMPKIIDADATAHFTGTSMVVDVYAGKTLDATTVTGGKVAIPNFNDIITPADIEATVKTTAKNALTLISEKHLNIGKGLNLDPATASGEVQGSLKINVPLYPEDAGMKESSFDLMKYDIKADVQNATLKQIRKKWNVDNMSGTFAANNQAITIAGNGTVQGQKAQLQVRYDQPKSLVEYELLGDVPVENLKIFDVSIPKEIELSGILGADVTVREEKAGDNVKAHLDLKSARLGLPVINWSKENGIPATLDVSYKRTPKTIELPEIVLSGTNTMLKAGLSLSDTQDVLSATISTFRYGRNDFALEYRKDNAIKNIRIHGKALDLYALKDPKAPTKNPFKNFEFLNAQADLGSVYFTKNDGLKNLHADFDCPTDICVSGSVTATTKSGQPLSLKLYKEGAKRNVNITSSDAGQVISAFDISDHMSDGKMELTGTFLDDKPDHPLKGRLLITDFRVVKGPVMTKLLSLASLTGFLDMLSGNGISFKKLSADFTLQGDTVDIAEGKAYGSALGIMLDGDIDPFHNGALNLKGTLVPSYSANSFLGKIPVLGTVLVGGKDQGLIAARFSVKGTSEEPDVSVNPLSLLTPGFLRNLFDVFDEPKPTKKNEKTTPSEDTGATELKKENTPASK
ncbi:MAG: AsmA-like C-terminal domain-containing protein [Rickettsiales bacterium]